MMKQMAKSPYKRPPAQPPETPESGAALISAYALKLFDRQNGEGANWPLMASSLFKASFDALDRLPDDACRKMAGRVHTGAYERVTEGPKGNSAASNTGPDHARSEPSNTASLKSNEPGGENGPASAS